MSVKAVRLVRSALALAALTGALGLQMLAPTGGVARAAVPLLDPTVRIDGLDAGEAMGLTWVRGYTLPADENPGFGNSAPCVRLGRHGRILVGIGYQDVPCTVDANTTILVWGISSTCDNADPSSPYYAADEPAQRACAVATLAPYVATIHVTIDGGAPIDLHQQRYAIFSPQEAVTLRDDNPFGVPAGPATFTAYGWMAWLNKLQPGRHTLRSKTTFNDGTRPHVISLDLDVTG